MIGQRAYRAFWCEVGIGWFFLEPRSQLTAGDVTEICFGNMGRILGKWRDLHGESFALSATESQTRTRGWATTTTSCVVPFTRGQENGHNLTQSRGTPIDVGDFRGTGVNITNLVTACNNRTGRGGQFFPGAKKGGAINPPFKNCPKWNLHQPSLVFPHPLVFLVADELPLARPSGLALEHEVQELLRDSEELRGLGGCAEGGL